MLTSCSNVTGIQEAPREYAEVIAQCWHDDPAARPEFSALLRPLVDLHDTLNPGSRLTMSAASVASTVAGSAGACLDPVAPCSHTSFLSCAFSLSIQLEVAHPFQFSLPLYARVKVMSDLTREPRALAILW